MNNLKEIFDNYQDISVLVIGDAMVDTYLEGSSLRIGREAPVPVVAINKLNQVPGGAANTAAGTADLGAKTYFVSVVGKDKEGKWLLKNLKKRGINTKHIQVDKKRVTLVKNRVISNSQILLRYDFGGEKILDKKLEAKVINSLKSFYKKIDVVIISDYGYGVITEKIKKAVNELQKKYPKILAVDAKKLANYKIESITLVKPNFNEALELIGQKDTQGYPSKYKLIKENGKKILKITRAKIAAVTMDESGALVLNGLTKIYKTSSLPKKNINAIGAGDTYICAFSLSLAAGASVRLAGKIAANASQISVSKEGTNTCSLEELKEVFYESKKVITNKDELKELVDNFRKQGKKITFTNGCFDVLHAGHVNYLEKAKKQGDILIVGLNSDGSVKRLKGKDRPINRFLHRAKTLLALESVNHVVQFTEDTPVNLLGIVKPNIYVKGDDYTRDTLVETPVVEKYGGKVKIIKSYPRKSSSSIIEKLKEPEENSEPVQDYNPYYNLLYRKYSVKK